MAIKEVFDLILQRLPSTYPKAKLIIHSSISELTYEYQRGSHGDKQGPPPFGYCDNRDNSVHVVAQLSREKHYDVAWYLLHEIGHLYAYERYGERDRRWSDYKNAEQYANRFADRWVKKLKKEGLV